MAQLNRTVSYRDQLLTLQANIKRSNASATRYATHAEFLPLIILFDEVLRDEFSNDDPKDIRLGATSIMIGRGISTFYDLRVGEVKSILRFLSPEGANGERATGFLEAMAQQYKSEGFLRSIRDGDGQRNVRTSASMPDMHETPF